MVADTSALEVFASVVAFPDSGLPAVSALSRSGKRLPDTGAPSGCSAADKKHRHL